MIGRIDEMPVEDDNESAGETLGEPADDKPKPVQRRSPAKGALDNRAPPTIWENSGGDANLLYDEILNAGKARGLPADAFKINLKQLTPRQVTLGGIPGEAVPNGDALLTHVQNLHMQSRTRGDARYEVRIQDRARGTFVSTGYLQLPDREELASQYGPPSPYAPPSGFGYAPPFRGYAPPNQMSQPPTPYVPPAPQVVAQPPPQAPQPPQHTDPMYLALMQQNAQLQERLAYTAGQMERFFGMSAGGGGGFGATPPEAQPPQPPAYVMPPPYMPPTPPAPNLEERVTNSVIDRLLQLGVIQRPGVVAAPVAAVAPPPTPAGAVSQLGESLTVLKDFVKQFGMIRAAQREVVEAFEPDGLGSLAEDEPEPPKPPPNPEDNLPWDRIKLGEWGWAIDKETGNTSVQGVLAEMMNDEKIRQPVFDFMNRGLGLIEEMYRGTRGGVPVGQLRGPPQQLAPHQPPPVPTNGSAGGWGS
jgi:hypothetical protein